MTINWIKSKSGQSAVIPGYGRFQIKQCESGFRVTQNGEPIGSIHKTPQAAEQAVAGIVKPLE
jgi:hypothetical protein